MRTVAIAALVSLTSMACSPAPQAPLPVSQLPDIDTAAVLKHISMLASDEFEGRAPGSRGETLTVQYLIDQFRAAGAEPGNPDGTWVQRVPLVGLTPQPRTPFVVRRGGETRTLKIDAEIVPSSKHVTEVVDLVNSELVFVGYGVQAPEFNWDDFKGADLSGKTLLVLVNDPPVPDRNDSKSLDASVFGGKGMTYYGRWTYKREKAAELGAAAVFVIHETGPAGYPFSVIQGMDESFNLAAPDGNRGRPAIEGWISRDAAADLLKLAGHDFDALKARAATRDFAPVALGATASFSLGQRIRTVDSQNVVARIPGRDPVLKHEHVVYTAHWDHLGVGTPVDGDAIYNGAVDNASGTATLLEIARAIRRLPTPSKRSVLFLAVAAEEQGLLGSDTTRGFRSIRSRRRWRRSISTA